MNNSADARATDINEHLTRPPRKGKRALWIGSSLLAFLVLNYSYPVFLMIRPVRISVAEDTTYFIRPLDDEGFVNYPAALNQTLLTPVSAEENAAIDLLLACGGREETLVYADLCRLLDVEPLPRDGDYFRPISHYGKEIANWSPAEIKLRETELKEVCRRPWTESEFPELTAWLKSVNTGLDRVKSASTKSGYYAPRASEKMLMSRLSPYAHAPTMARGLAARAMLAIERGDFQRGWSDLMCLHRLALLLDLERDGIAHLTASAIERIAAEAELRFFHEAIEQRLDWEALRNDLTQMPKRSPVSSTLVQARVFLLDSMTNLARGRTSLRALVSGDPAREDRTLRLLDWNVVCQTVNQWHDRFEKAGNMPTIAGRLAATREAQADLAEITQQPQSWSQMVLKKLTRVGIPTLTRKQASIEMGNRMVALFPFMSDQMIVSAALARNTRNLTRLCLEVAAYRDQHGRFPSSIDELDVNDLDTVDQLTNLPFVFRRDQDTVKIYMVGPNLQDDGGPNDDRYVSDDFGVIWATR